MDASMTLALVLAIVIGVCQASCPSGWIAKGTHCYYMYTTGLNMAAARTYCRDRSATLLPVTDVDVLTMVEELYPSNYRHWTAGYFWNTTGHSRWIWTDQGYNSIRDVAEENFDMNPYHETLLESSASDPGLCLALVHGEPLRIRNCANLHRLICSRKHHSRICPSGYGASGTRCLSLGQYKHTHKDAESICENRYGQLFEPRTHSDLNGIYELASQYAWTNNDLRVGITYEDSAWRFTSDGAQIPAGMWSDNFPLMQSNKTCGLYNATTKMLSNVDCNDLHYYICIYKSKPHCPAGYLSFGRSSECYMVAPFLLDYPSSNSFCKMWGGEVATIRDDYTKTLVNELQYYRNDAVGHLNLWVDLKDATYEGMYQFSDGTMMRGVTLSGTSSNCIYLYAKLLYGTSCDNQASVYPLCMAKKDYCPLGFLKRGNNCYRYSEAARYYSGSEIFCGYYSSLLSWTYNQSALVSGLTLKGYQPVNSTAVPYWIGGVLNTTNEMWTFSNKETYLSNSAELGGLWEANYPVAGENCMLVNVVGRLETKSCSAGIYNFICETTENHIGMDLPQHDFPILQPSCFMEDQYDPEFKISPGNYDPEELSMTLCKSRCLASGFKYAGATYGKYCFCSNILTLSMVSISNCNQSCSSSTSGEMCGSANGNYITVLNVGSTGAVGKASISGVSLSASPMQVNVEEAVTFTTSITVGEGSLFRLRFGEGFGFTLGTKLNFTAALPSTGIPTTKSYKYYHPGDYVATVMYYDEEGIKSPAYQSVVVKVINSPPSPVKLDCPVVIEPEELFYCHVTVFQGSSLLLTFSSGDGSIAENYTISEPKIQHMGFPAPQEILEDMVMTALNSTGKPSAAVIMPWTHLKESSVLHAFTAHVSTPGEITFMILRPTCSGSPVCPATGKCDSSCAGLNSTSYSCSSGSFCTHGLSCFDQSLPMGSCKSSVGPMPDDYQVIVEQTVVTTAGFNYIKIDQAVHLWPPLQQGDVVGFIPGSAVVAYHLTSKESDIGFSATDSYLSANGENLGVQHYVSATVSLPVTVDLPQNYSVIGNYTYHVTVQNSLGSVENSSIIACQIPIILASPGIPIFEPPHVTLNNYTQVSIPVLSGSDIFVMIDWGDNNITWKYFSELDNYTITEVHQYKEVGSYSPVIKIFNKHTIEDQIPLDQWTFWHLLLCQIQCNSSLWTFVNDGPVLSPPGNLLFTISAPAGEELPTNASFSINYGDGDHSGGLDYPDGTKMICGGPGVNGTPFCSDGFSYKEPKTYVAGNYNSTFNCRNNASSFAMTIDAIVYASIEGVTASPMYLPFLPIGGTTLYQGYGPVHDQFPVERNVTFVMQLDQGTVFYYYAEFLNGTVLGNSTTNKLDLKFEKPGRYTVRIYAVNPLQESPPITATVEVAESVAEVYIDDYNLVTDADTDKTFKIVWKSKGSFSCFIVDYFDNTPVDVWRTLTEEYDECQTWLEKNAAALRISSTMNKRGLIPENDPFSFETAHRYVNKGFYVMSIYAFNKMSRSNMTLNVTVAPVPCTPPLLYLKENSTKFFEPLKIMRSFTIRVESVCKLNCSNSLNTSKFWTGVSINEEWGHPMDEVNMDGWDSRNKSILSIPPRTLNYGTYKFTYSVVIEDEWLKIHEPDIPPFRREKSTYIKVTKSPLVVLMNSGGVAKVVLGFNKTFVINPAEFSYDPDWLDAKDFDFKWYCHRISPTAEILLRNDTEGNWPSDGVLSKPLTSLEDVTTYLFNDTTNTTEAIEDPDNGGCFGEGPGRILIEGGTLELNTIQLRKTNVTYRFVVVLSKDTRKAEGSIDVELVPGSPPGVDVMCQIAKMCRFTSDGMYINPNSRLALMGSCKEDCYGYLGYVWSIYTFVNNTETLIPDGHIFMVNPEQPNMVIRNELFMTYKDVLEFHVKLTIIRHVDKEKGQGFMYLLINTPPGKGKCTLTPPKGRLLNENPADIDPATGEPKELGRALIEDYYCACLNFVDDQNDKITKYTFYLKHTAFGYIKNLKFGVDFKDRFAFPYGNWSMWVTITDEYGAASTIFIANFSTSLPTRSELAAWESKSEILRASGEGDQARLSQLLLASTSISSFKLVDDVIVSTTTTQSSIGFLPAETTTMDPLVKKELEEKARKELEGKQMKAASEKQAMISQLSSNNVDTLDDCAQLLSTIASIIGTGDLVDLKGKDSAISVISGTCTAKVLLNTTINDPKDAESLISNNMQAISSLVTGTSDKVIEDNVLPSDIVNTEKGDYGDYETPGVEDVDDGSLTSSEVERLKLKKVAVKVQREKAVSQVTDMLETVGRMQKKLLSIVFPGEDPVTVNTEDGLTMTLVMMKSGELLGYQLWQGGGLYEFPDICDILKEEKEGPGNCSSTESGNFTVGIQAIAWPTILQSFGSGAKDKLDRTTKTMQLSLLQRISAVDVKVIPVEDLEPESEIVIYIPRGSRQKSRTQVLDPLVVYPNEIMSQSVFDDGPLVCTSLNITQPDSSVNVELVLQRSEANIVVFIRKYFKANLVFYDKVINPKTEARVTNVSQPLFDTMDPLTNLTIPEEYNRYEIFLTNDFTRNDTGLYYICVGEFANETDDEIFWREPEMYNLTESNMTRQWSTNFTIRSYTSSCLFYNGETQSWDNDGCRVLNANYTHTICSCNHLTSFGSGFFPQPNMIDFNKLLTMNAADNPTIIITMIVSLCIYIMVLIWGRFKDKEDLTKLGATPLPDNDPRDKYLYEIMVFTGGNEEAATKSKVQFTLSGDQAESEVRTFDDPSRPIFKRNAIDIFVMAVPGALGSLQYLRVWHDNSGKGKMASWYLRYIIIRDVQTGQKYEFICNRWFAVEHDDFKIDRLLPVAGDVQKKEFKHLFQTTSHKNLYDGHLWFSVFVRPARSRFTRVQRITACMALLYLSMVTNAMFFGVIPEEPGSGGLALGPFSVSPAAIGVGMISNLITFPPTLIIIQLFRKASPKFKRISRIQKAMEKQKEEKRKELERKKLLKQTATHDVSRVVEDAEVPKSGQPEKLEEPEVKRKKQKSLPWWTLYIAWIVAILSIGAGGFFTFAYGVQFGEEVTKKWLGALLVSFFSSILFTQPIKVILMAVIFSAVFKKPVEDEDDADFDEREPVLGEDEEWMHQLGPGTREKKKPFKPVDEKFIKSAKIERQKEIKMWDVIYDIGAYAFFIWIVLVLSHGNRDPNSFLMKTDLDQRFILASLDENNESNLYSVQNRSLLFHWLKTVVVDEIIMQENYNNQFNDKHDNRLLLNDQVSLLLGYTTLRQIRIKENTCRLPKIVKMYITKECRSKTSLLDEEDEDFGVGWKPLADGVKAKEEYTHKGSLELDGMPFWGKIDVYSGSGYQVKLVGGRDAIIQKLNELEASHWIDRRTRALFVEFSIYNAQVNLFGAIRICIEQGPEGALHPYVKINTMKLLRYHEGFGLFVMICEGLFIAFIIYYTYRELKDMCRDKKKYWKDAWNYLEIIVIVLGWSAIVFYGIRTALGVYIMKKFKTNKNGYIKLDYAAYIDEVFLYIISFLVFFATLKFIKLLRFNKRIGMLSSTLKQCASDLSGFMVAFLLSFLAAAQLFYLLHYSNTLNFSTFMSSLESTFSAMLGKIEYDEIAQSSPRLGPITFFVFAFFTGIIMVNLLLTLVLRSFYDIKQDIKKQGNEYEILDFIVTKIKKATGIAPKSSTIGPTNAATEEDKKLEDDKTDEFPEKVDQLLTYINQFYFDSKLDFNNKEWVKKMSMQNRDQSALGPHSGRARTLQGWHGATDSDQPRSTFKNIPKTPSQKSNSIAELSDL